MMRNLTKTLLLSALALAASPALAHFPWLAISPEGRVLYFFGETPAERDYEMPASIAKAKVTLAGKPGELEMEGVDSAEFVGLRSAASVESGATLRSRVTYGVYKGARLEYLTLHRGGPLPKDREAAGKEPGWELDAQLVDTDAGVDVYVLLNGKPLADAEVRLFCEEGHEEGEGKTDENGRISFTDEEVEGGLNGIVVGHTAAGERGEIAGKAYETVSRYLTVSFIDPEGFIDGKSGGARKESAKQP